MNDRQHRAEAIELIRPFIKETVITPYGQKQGFSSRYPGDPASTPGGKVQNGTANRS